jgi:hypothetical protein
MTIVDVNPGVCGLKSKIIAKSEDMQMVKLDIQSDCPHISQMNKELEEVDGFIECFSKFGDSRVYEIAKKYCRHPVCPVPGAILKGIEASIGLALPREVVINIKNED